MLQAVINAFKIGDLRRKILFTLGMLVIFRVIAHIPVPGVDFAALNTAFDTSNPANQQFGGILNVLNIFSGGTLQNFSVAAMGVYPYITASIIIQLLTGVIPRLTELSKEGETGRNQLNRYTHFLTVPLAALQAFGQAGLLNSQFNALPKFGVDFLLTITVIISLVCGTMFLVWLGELITENGIGQGISIIIFGGIVARLPAQVLQLTQSGSGSGIFSVVLFAAIGLLTIVGIILINEGQRRIPVHYSRSIMRGGRMMRQAGTSFIPLRVNSSGMIPLIFALSIMSFPVIVAGFFTAASTEWVRNAALWVYGTFQPSSPLYNIVYFIMVVAFTFFYTSVVFAQQRIAENLQKSGGAVPGIRPGPNTDRFLNTVLTRITVAGAFFLGIVAILPWLASLLTGTQLLNFSSTSLLIVVGVAIDTMKQLESQLLMRRYEGFINR
ncbi:MAG: preprotein translocase subunit SecY [Chloroflexia bacterium]